MVEHLVVHGRAIEVIARVRQLSSRRKHRLTDRVRFAEHRGHNHVLLRLFPQHLLDDVESKHALVQVPEGFPRERFRIDDVQGVLGRQRAQRGNGRVPPGDVLGISHGVKTTRGRERRLHRQSERRRAFRQGLRRDENLRHQVTPAVVVKRALPVGQRIRGNSRLREDFRAGRVLEHHQTGVASRRVGLLGQVVDEGDPVSRAARPERDLERRGGFRLRLPAGRDGALPVVPRLLLLSLRRVLSQHARDGHGRIRSDGGAHESIVRAPPAECFRRALRHSRRHLLRLLRQSRAHGPGSFRREHAFGGGGDERRRDDLRASASVDSFPALGSDADADAETVCTYSRTGGRHRAAPSGAPLGPGASTTRVNPLLAVAFGSRTLSSGRTSGRDHR